MNPCKLLWIHEAFYGPYLLLLTPIKPGCYSPFQTMFFATHVTKNKLSFNPDQLLFFIPVAADLFLSESLPNTFCVSAESEGVTHFRVMLYNVINFCLVINISDIQVSEGECKMHCCNLVWGTLPELIILLRISRNMWTPSKFVRCHNVCLWCLNVLGYFYTQTLCQNANIRALGMQWPHQVSFWPSEVDDNDGGIGIPLLLS